VSKWIIGVRRRVAERKRSESRQLGVPTHPNLRLGLRLIPGAPEGLATSRPPMMVVARLRYRSLFEAPQISRRSSDAPTLPACGQRPWGFRGFRSELHSTCCSASCVAEGERTVGFPSTIVCPYRCLTINTRATLTYGLLSNTRSPRSSPDSINASVSLKPPTRTRCFRNSPCFKV